jgi:hypothetical protein
MNIAWERMPISLGNTFPLTGAALASGLLSLL